MKKYSSILLLSFGLLSGVAMAGGTTEAALAVLEQGGLSELITRALTAARDRSRELADQLGK